MLRNRSKTIHVGNCRLKAFYCAGQWWCLVEVRASNIPADVKYNAWVEMWLFGDDEYTTRDSVLKFNLAKMRNSSVGVRHEILKAISGGAPMNQSELVGLGFHHRLINGCIDEYWLPVREETGDWLTDYANCVIVRFDDFKNRPFSVYLCICNGMIFLEHIQTVGQVKRLYDAVSGSNPSGMDFYDGN